MRTTRLFLGRILAWVTLPLAIVFLRGSHRTRVLVISGDRLLVVKSFIHHGRWSLPGGGVHKGENPLNGAIRELKEETGVVLKPSELTTVAEKPFSSYGVSTHNT
jgi:8-oxo-dGTP pyrophosphatase MutT (NUDIX family)